MVTHSSVLAWEIPWTEEPGGLSSMGCKELDMTEHPPTHTHKSLSDPRSRISLEDYHFTEKWKQCIL